MLDKNEFDFWSDSYDDFVKQSEENNQYPFASYSNIMNEIYETIRKKPSSKVLDIGFGTGLLATKLYNEGHEITGIDFSSEMIKIATEKMPKAKLIEWDFTLGLPSFLNNKSFDFIVSTYALHHLTDEGKVDFISSLLKILEPNGTILIGDVAFETREDLLECKSLYKDIWDNDEIYFVFSELKKELSDVCNMIFHKFSFCSGIIEVIKMNFK